MQRLTLLVALFCWGATPALGQEWQQYVNTEDGFAVNFPGSPNITETTWRSQLDYRLPARVYHVDRGEERYVVTVVDYSSLEQQGVERAASCPPGNAQCRENAGPILGPGYWKHDERGAIVYATFTLIQQDVRVTSLAWEWQDLVEGHSIQLTNEAEQTRTSAYIAMHEHKLYILEGTVPLGYPEPGLFQQSLGWVDADGRRIRYELVYSNAYHALQVYPAPPIVGR
jgi:hypothetical protein